LLKDDSAAHYSSSSEISTYLIQPGPALAKSQAHGQLAKEGGWKKLAAGNLYTSEICPTSSPFYKRYEVLEVAKPYKLKNAVDAGSIERIGFPEHPDQIRKKLGWKEGRAVKLFALKIGSTKSMVLTKYLD
jgi:hypothetical protein